MKSFFWMGLVRITSWYPNFNGKPFRLATQRRSTEWLGCHPKSCELWRMRTGSIVLPRMSLNSTPDLTLASLGAWAYNLIVSSENLLKAVFFFFFFFFLVLSDLNQAVPDHLADESARWLGTAWFKSDKTKKKKKKKKKRLFGLSARNRLSLSLPLSFSPLSYFLSFSIQKWKPFWAFSFCIHRTTGLGDMYNFVWAMTYLIRHHSSCDVKSPFLIVSDWWSLITFTSIQFERSLKIAPYASLVVSYFANFPKLDLKKQFGETSYPSSEIKLDTAHLHV